MHTLNTAHHGVALCPAQQQLAADTQLLWAWPKVGCSHVCPGRGDATALLLFLSPLWPQQC